MRLVSAIDFFEKQPSTFAALKLSITNLHASEMGWEIVTPLAHKHLPTTDTERQKAKQDYTTP